MKKTFLIPLLSIGLLLAACSGNDNTSEPVNINSENLVGKWFVTKAIYKGSTDTIYYTHTESCGKELLEFQSDHTVQETIYVDSDCRNGVGSEFEWWTSNEGLRMGYQESETTKRLTVSNDQLFFDGWDDWGVRKYYTKIN